MPYPKPLSHRWATQASPGRRFRPLFGLWAFSPRESFASAESALIRKEDKMIPTPPIRVLLVDDERDFIRALARRLEQRGMQIALAFDGPAALARVEADADLEVVVLDMAMPGMDGLETLGQIRRKRPLVETVMLTGHATLASAVEAIKQGAFDYLMKPCDLDLLLGKIAAAAARRQQRKTQLRDIQSTPYISDRDRKKRIAKILSAP